MAMQDLRQDYAAPEMDAARLPADPLRLFQEWFDHATASGNREPNAFTLATVSPDGRPRARTLLLKGLDPNPHAAAEGGSATEAAGPPPPGLVFYTNYNSAKGAELEANPFAAMNFLWENPTRAVRVEGGVARVSREETDAYFRTRPRGSQLGAWCSHQSQVIAGRDVLESRFALLSKQYPESSDIPTPTYWGGYRLTPDVVEFWQGQSSRLHDRFRYTRRGGDASWVIERLSP